MIWKTIRFQISLWKLAWCERRDSKAEERIRDEIFEALGPR